MSKARNALGLVLAVMLSVVLAAPSGAAGSRDGQGLVVAKNLGRGQVTVDDAVFLVDARTVIEDLDGKRIPLVKVPLRTDPPNTMNQTEPGAVKYQAVQTARGWVLLKLALIEAEPQ